MESRAWNSSSGSQLRRHGPHADGRAGLAVGVDEVLGGSFEQWWTGLWQGVQRGELELELGGISAPFESFFPLIDSANY